MASIFSSEVPALLQTHFDQLHLGSGIAVEIILERGYRSVLGKKQLADLSFSKAQQRTPGLLIPLHAPDGSPAGYQYRPDHPRPNPKGKPIKYETPAGAGIRIDMPRRCQTAAGNLAIPLWITEGAKKADTLASQGICAVNLSGVWGFKGKNLLGGIAISADLDNIAFNDREVNLAFDSDITDKPEVRQAMNRLAEHLHRRDAQVFIARLPQDPAGKKVGVDDYLLIHTIEELLALREAHVSEKAEHRYECREDGLGYFNDDGAWLSIIPVPTSIVALETEAEGEAQGIYTLMVQIDEQNRVLRLTSDQLADARTLRAAFLGLGIALSPRREHLVTSALLTTSGDYTKNKLYRRTGWERGRYIAPGRELPGIRVDLPQTAYVNLTGSKIDAAQAALCSYLEAFPASQTTIIVAHAFLATLARPAGLQHHKYCLHLTGRTGTLKTSMACAILALWSGEDWEMQPVLKWGEGATNNAIIAHAAHLADAPILIDNYKPSTGKGAKDFISLLHNILEGGERERLTRQSTLRPARELHAWPLTTGEDIPQQDAASMARILLLRFSWSKGQVNYKLAQCQSNAHHLPALLRRWLDWLECNLATIKTLGTTMADRRERWTEWLRRYHPKAVNPLRLATNLSLQEIAWEAMLSCPELATIIAPFSTGHKKGLEVIAADMSRVTAEALEAEQWLDALSSLISSGKLYLRSLMGDTISYGVGDRPGQLVGWHDWDSIYLLPTVAQAEVFEALRRGGQPLSITPQALYKQLDELGTIAQKGKDGRTLIVKKIDGRSHKVLQLRRSALERGDDEDEDGVEI